MRGARGRAGRCPSHPARRLSSSRLDSRSVTDLLLLTGDDLTVEDVWDVAIGGRDVGLAPSAVEQMGRSRGLLDELRGEHTYGVNTGLRPLRLGVDP